MKKSSFYPMIILIIVNYCNKNGEVSLVYYHYQDHREFIFFGSLKYYNHLRNKKDCNI